MSGMDLTLFFAAAMPGALQAADLADPVLSTAYDAHYAKSSLGVPLPPLALRARVGGADAASFLFLSDQHAQILRRFLAARSGIYFLDLGGGCGKLARGLLDDPRIAGYLLLDIDPDLVQWCNAWLRPAGLRRFLAGWIDVRSASYRPTGAVEVEAARFPLVDGCLDLTWAGSLFTHLEPAAAAHYLAETRRCSKPGAGLLATFHIEPVDQQDFSGDSHRADYHTTAIRALAEQSGWQLVAALGDVGGQELLYLQAAG